MTLREMNKLIANMTYKVVLYNGDEYYPPVLIDRRDNAEARLSRLCLPTMKNWTEEELDNSELTAILEVDGIITFYYYVEAYKKDE